MDSRRDFYDTIFQFQESDGKDDDTKDTDKDKDDNNE